MELQPWLKNILNMKNPTTKSGAEQHRDTEMSLPAGLIADASTSIFEKLNNTRWVVEGYDLRDILKELKKPIEELLYIATGLTSTEQTGKVQIWDGLAVEKKADIVCLYFNNYQLLYSEKGTFGGVSHIRVMHDNTLIYDQSKGGYTSDIKIDNNFREMVLSYMLKPLSHMNLIIYTERDKRSMLMEQRQETTDVKMPR